MPEQNEPRAAVLSQLTAVECVECECSCASWTAEGICAALNRTAVPIKGTGKGTGKQISLKESLGPKRSPITTIRAVQKINK